MKLKPVKRKTIYDFALKNPGSRNSIRLWMTLLKKANWAKPEDISETFGSADLLGNGSNRVVFNIAGNHYRMICKYHFGSTRVYLYVKWIGPHSEYSKLYRENEQYDVDSY